MSSGRRGPEPPRLMCRILEATLPGGAVGESIKGDLDQEFQEARARLRFPRIWYAFEAAKLAVRYLVRRAIVRMSPQGASTDRWNSEKSNSERSNSERSKSEPGGYPPAHRRVVHGKGGLGMSDVIQDLRYGLRQLRRSPVLSSVSAISLAVGIAASTSMFAVYYGFLRAASVCQPGRHTDVLSGKLDDNGHPGEPPNGHLLRPARILGGVRKYGRLARGERDPHRR